MRVRNITEKRSRFQLAAHDKTIYRSNHKLISQTRYDVLHKHDVLTLLTHFVTIVQISFT